MAKPKITLQGVLHLVILGLTFAAAAAILATAVLNHKILDAFETYSQESVPFLETVILIQSENQYLLEGLSNLPLKQTTTNVEQAVSSLQASLDKITVLLKQINTSQEQESQQQVFEDINSINTLVNQQHFGMIRHLKLESESQSAHSHLLALIKKLNTNIDFAVLDLKYKASTEGITKIEQSLADLEEIKLAIDNLPIITAQAALMNSTTGVINYKNNAGEAIRQASTMTSTLTDKNTKQELSKTLTEIYREHKRSNGFYALKLKSIKAHQQVIDNNMLIRNKLNTFSVNTQASINQLTKKADSNLESLNLLVKTAITFSAVLLLMLLIGYGVAYKWVISRLIFKPFSAATRAIRDLSQGQHDYLPFDTKMHELKQMDNALQVFKNNAAALRERESALIQTNKELDQSNDKLQTFVRVSSHDLKSPLRGIRILSQQLYDNIEEKDWDTAKYNVERIDTRAQRLDNLLNALLDFVRVDRKTWKFENIDIRQIITEQLELLPLKDKIQLTITTDIEHASLYATPFATVTRSLVDNALKHHDRQEGTIEVYVSQQGNNLELSVTDDGPGIAPEYQERIFEPFQTIRPKDEVEGAGMGLSIISKLINEVGGEIRIESPLAGDRGSRFIVEWPLPKKPLD